MWLSPDRTWSILTVKAAVFDFAQYDDEYLEGDLGNKLECGLAVIWKSITEIVVEVRLTDIDDRFSQNRTDAITH